MSSSYYGQAGSYDNQQSTSINQNATPGAYTAAGGTVELPFSFDYPSQDTSSVHINNIFFTSNHALGAGRPDQTTVPRPYSAGVQQQNSPEDGPGASAPAGSHQSQHSISYSALPDFDLGGDTASEVGSTTSRGGGGGGGTRPKKRAKSGSSATALGYATGGDNGDIEGGTAADRPPLKKARSAPTSKAKGKQRSKEGAGTDGADDTLDVQSANDDSSSFGIASASTKASKAASKPKKSAGEKKKKAGRACAACQKAHLTCDDARPCARCVKKGIADTCHDGTRKKAKYLMEVPDELLDLGRSATPMVAHQPAEDYAKAEVQDAGIGSSGPDTVSPSGPLAEPGPPAFTFDTPMFFEDTAFNHEFGSEAANLEYAILSSMLNGNGFATDAFGTTGTALQPSNTAGQDAINGGDPRLSGSANGSTMLVNSPLGHTMHLSAAPSHGGGLVGGFLDAGGNQAMSSPRIQDSQNLFLGLTGQQPLQTSGGAAGATSASNARGSNTGENLFSELESGESSNAYGQNTAQQPGQRSQQQSDVQGQAGSSTSAAPTAHTMTAEQAYRSVTKPYPYAQSYHYLIKHLKSRFEKNDILRIVRALATIRPSLIALQMPLTEEDEIFVERTFQRTLVELNKLVGFSGTPTVVWRRTGEVCLVGTEFCLLTGWNRDDLVGKKYIFELLDTSSVVDLYEAFAKHAFESTSSSVTMQCVVLGPTGRPVPCAFCFSIRRDLFSCPQLVVGSFLPILL